MSCHHCRYFGCQCSSARCRRLFEWRSTLFGIRSAEIIVNSQGPNPESQVPRNPKHARLGIWDSESGIWLLSTSPPVELRPAVAAVYLERTVLADRVRPL